MTYLYCEISVLEAGMPRAICSGNEALLARSGSAHGDNDAVAANASHPTKEET